MNTDTVILKLKQELVPYLKSHDIDILKGNIKCIFKDKHKNGTDRKPSMGLVPNHDATHCFTCRGVADIFVWANHLEDLPIGRTRRFYEETVPYLAKKLLNIDYTPEQMSPEMVKKSLYRQVYNTTIEYTLQGNKLVADEIERRGWSKEIAREFNLGGVDSFNEYISYMNDTGFSTDLLIECGLCRFDTHKNQIKPPEEQLIRKGSLIIPVYDAEKRIIRIVTKSLDDKGPKYDNSPNNILNEDEPKLYNLNKIKGQETVYVVEGYSDVITMCQYDHRNTVAILGASLNEQHIRTLKRNGVRNIMIMLDGDRRWESALHSSLLQIMQNYQIGISIIILPEEFDPDDYLRKYQTLSGLEPISPFSWLLSLKQTEKLVKENKIARFTDIIANTDSAIIRNKWTKDLANISGIDEKIIAQDVNEKLVKKKNEEYKNQMEFKQKMYKLLKGNSVTEEDIWSFMVRHRNNKRKYEIDPITIASEIAQETRILTDTANTEPAIRLGKNLTKIERDLEGFARNGNIITVSGDSQAGKSSFSRFLAMQMAQNNSDITVVYFSMEDGKEKTIPAMLSTMNGYKINSNKNKNRMRIDYGEKGITAYEEAWDKMVDLMRQKRILIYDRTIGESLHDIENVIDALKKEETGDLVLFIDSLNALSSMEDSSHENEAVIRKTRTVRTMSTLYDIPIFIIAEIKKTSGEAGNQDLAYTKRLEYASDMIMFVDPIHGESPTAPLNIPYLNTIVPVPIQRMRITKNKINGEVGSWFIQFARKCNYYKEPENDYRLVIR
jgi:DNA primase